MHSFNDDIFRFWRFSIEIWDLVPRYVNSKSLGATCRDIWEGLKGVLCKKASFNFAGRVLVIDASQYFALDFNKFFRANPWSNPHQSLLLRAYCWGKWTDLDLWCLLVENAMPNRKRRNQNLENILFVNARLKLSICNKNDVLSLGQNSSSSFDDIFSLKTHFAKFKKKLQVWSPNELL